MVNSLLITKLYLPSSSSPGQSPFVQRKRLLEKLNQGLTSKLILVSAAAGFGKTTVLSEWAHGLKLSISWLSLDERDNDLIRFWTYFVTALQQRHQNIGEATLAMLRFAPRSSEGSTEPISAEAFLTPLINELAQLQTDVVLVLDDDYHLITTPAIHDALTFLLEHLPRQVHLAIATRVDPPLPIARLQVRAQLTELHANDLRFTPEETTAFLHQSLPQSLTEVQVAALQTQTEGWIAGLQLAMLSLREATNSATLIDSFSGSQRNVLDYLVEEVLERQSQPLKNFLLRTSILEQMCYSLCEAVVEEAVGASMLEQLERQNLFVVLLDPDRTWYRYHHLFAEALRYILQRTESDLAHSQPASEFVVNCLPSPVFAPTPEVVVHRFPIGKIMWQCPPDTAITQDIQDSVEDRLQINAAGTTSRFGRRNQTRQKFPLRTREIARI